ncbi:MAG: ribosome-binding factor A [Hydrogenophilales bacterium 28-61-23]|nr:MAG: ribosome-binding factor A [Hydrogenophilales bacterium 28-61-23]
MSNNNPRSRRVAEQIRQELASILMREMKDPRVVGVSFTAVDVTSDLEHAKVWFTTFNPDNQAALKGLASAAGFLRSELAKRMSIRTVPKLNFHYDESVERGAHLSNLIDRAVEEDRRRPQDSSEDATENRGTDET